MRKLTTLSIVLFLCCACAPVSQTYNPVCDMKGMNRTQYRQDLKECRTYAEFISPADEALGSALGGAVLGAAMGAILGSGFDNVGRTAAIGAGMGGISACAGGAAGAVEKQKRMIRNCMRGRGYKVLE